MTLERSHDIQETSSGSLGTAMKVTNSTVNNDIANLRNEALEKKAAAEMPVEKAVSQPSDRVELSVNRAKIDRLTSTLATMESMNTEKIESIKSQIADGTYNISGRAVAEKMLRSVGIETAGGDE
ncbi:MAG: flagellar biosynthesis anti-sigma factor FlgM [Geobacteraceae bacterium]|nr:flagellar biosynthesis anti-sigma factor FlgM [Geobacteraceae bacterium]